MIDKIWYTICLSPLFALVWGVTGTRRLYIMLNRIKVSRGDVIRLDRLFLNSYWEKEEGNASSPESSTCIYLPIIYAATENTSRFY